MAGASSTLLLDELFESGDPRFLAELLASDKEKKLGSFAPRLYGDRRPFAREALAGYIADGCARPHHRPLVKRLFKLAEKDGDDEVMGCFLVAFDRLLRRELVQARVWDPAARAAVLQWRLVGSANPRWASVFSSETRHYLRRRVWRYFRRLGFRDPARYGRAVRAALVRYQDAHLASPAQLLDAWGLMHALYRGSPAVTMARRGCALVEGRSLAELAPAPFRPDAWLGCFEEVFALLGAHSRTVRAFAVAWLRLHYAEELRGLSLARLRPLLASPHDEVMTFAAELLRDAPGLDLLPVDLWLELVAAARAEAVPIVCELFGRHVAAARVPAATCVGLCCDARGPVAELGLRLLRDEGRRDVELDGLVALGGAEVESVRRAGVAFALERLAAAADARPEQLRELIDARHADVRAPALASMGRFGDSPTLWSALPESPYPEVRAHLLERLEERLAALAPGTRQHVWASALLAVGTGGKQKPRVARQIAERIAAHPDEAGGLLPLLGVALRSLRAPERRAALAALVTAAERRPSLAAAVGAALPELAILDDAAMARASQGRGR